MTRIEQLLELQYNSFRGRKMQALKEVHKRLREYLGDEKYIAFLEKQFVENPMPKYIPISFPIN